MQEKLEQLRVWASDLWRRIVEQWNKFLSDNQDM